MDIVAWVYTLQQELLDAGQERLASLIDKIPELTHDNKATQVEALIPEALAAARALKNSWLEIYFRHWEMRNRLGNLAEGETALADIVGLLEFAHREENLPCPQSVCTTHDISGCYSNIDGPGWAEERKAVCEETLSRITPSRPCYICLNREYVDALTDQKRYDEALQRLDTLEQALKKHGEPEDGRLYKDRASLFCGLGRYKEALTFLDKAAGFDDGISTSEANRVDSDILRARILAHLGRVEEAWECFPHWGGIEPGDYAGWVRTACALAQKAPESNTCHLGGCLQQALDYMDKVGAHRFCIDIAADHARLALGRGIRWTAERALATAEKHLPRLRALHGADILIEEIRREAEACVSHPAPAEDSTLAARLAKKQERNPEQEAEWLLAAHGRRPEDFSLTLAAAEALEACHAYAEAAAFLRALTPRDETEQEHLFFKLIDIYLQAGNEAEALSVAARFEGSDTGPKQRGLAHWGRAYIALRRGQWAQVPEEARAALRYLPGALGPHRFIALALMKLKDFAGAVVAHRQVIEEAGKVGEDTTGDLWHLLTAACAAADWATARGAAHELDIELENAEGPIEEDWGLLRLRFHEDGGLQEYYGMRTGPCTARIISIADPDDVQHVRDCVVFDPTYIENPPEDEEEARHYIVPHNVIHVLEHAGYSAWLCDGADPGEAVFDALCAALEEKGYAVRLRMREGYTVANPAHGLTARGESDHSSRRVALGAEEEQPPKIGDADKGRLPGIYFAVASPPDATPKSAGALMSTLTKSWPHPLCFRDLARAAGVDTSPHEAVIELYGL